MAQFTLKGNPPITSSKIELPNIAELIFQPMFLNANIEEVYRFGSDFMKGIIDKAPINNDRKYISTTFMLQLVDSGTRTIKNQFGFQDEWHIDGNKSPYDDDIRSHLLLSECECMTEFLENPVAIDIDREISLNDFNLMINQNSDAFGLVGKKMAPNVFHSFTNYPHRASQPNGLEFRYMIRFIESDKFEYTPLESSYLKMSNVFNGLESMKSIERKHDSVILYRR